MIATANYIARKFGVRSAMPGFIAKKLCPDLVLIHGNYSKYEEASQKFRAILQKYDPDFESMGLDEANADFTTYIEENELSTPEQIGQLCESIRAEVFEATKLTMSCGIGANKMLAKMCSEMNKPNGQYMLRNDRAEILTFMKTLPIRKIPGIGYVSEQLLNGLGIFNCEDILSKLEEVYIVFSDSSFDFFLEAALGIGRAYHAMPQDRKSISVSRTFPIISTEQQIDNKIKDLSKMLGQDLEGYEKVGKHLCLTFKNHKFEVKTKNMQLPKYISSADDIYHYSAKIMRELLPTEPLRLIGIKISMLMDREEYDKVTLDKFFLKGVEKGSKAQDRRADAGEIICENAENQAHSGDSSSAEELAQSRKQDAAIASKSRSLGQPGDVENLDLKADEIQQIIETVDREDFSSNINSKSKQQLRSANLSVNPGSRGGLLEEEESKHPGNRSVSGPCEQGDQSANQAQEADLAAQSDFMRSVKEQHIPNIFVCPICNKPQECQGNSYRMNRHINQCLEKVNLSEQNQTRSAENQSPVNSDSKSGGKTSTGQRRSESISAEIKEESNQPQKKVTKRRKYNASAQKTSEAAEEEGARPQQKKR